MWVSADVHTHLMGNLSGAFWRPNTSPFQHSTSPASFMMIGCVMEYKMWWIGMDREEVVADGGGITC